MLSDMCMDDVTAVLTLVAKNGGAITEAELQEYFDGSEVMADAVSDFVGYGLVVSYSGRTRAGRVYLGPCTMNVKRRERTYVLTPLGRALLEFYSLDMKDVTIQ